MPSSCLALAISLFPFDGPPHFSLAHPPPYCSTFSLKRRRQVSESPHRPRKQFHGLRRSTATPQPPTSSASLPCPSLSASKLSCTASFLPPETTTTARKAEYSHSHKSASRCKHRNIHRGSRSLATGVSNTSPTVWLRCVIGLRARDGGTGLANTGVDVVSHVHEEREGREGTESHFNSSKGRNRHCTAQEGELPFP